MGLDQQQRLLRFEYAMKKPLSMNESRVLRELCLHRETARYGRVTTTQLVIICKLTKSQVLKAVAKLRARHIVHTHMGYGGYEGEHSLRREGDRT